MTLVISAVVISAIIFGEHALSRKLSRRFARDRSAVSRFVVRPAAPVTGSLSALSRKDAFPLEPDR
jgi:hypothetical protein